jgi:hypothetical protein
MCDVGQARTLIQLVSGQISAESEQRDVLAYSANGMTGSSVGGPGLEEIQPSDSEGTDDECPDERRSPGRTVIQGKVSNIQYSTKCQQSLWDPKILQIKENVLVYSIDWVLQKRQYQNGKRKRRLFLLAG